jgi:hypothetical protein
MSRASLLFARALRFLLQRFRLRIGGRLVDLGLVLAGFLGPSRLVLEGVGALFENVFTGLFFFRFAGDEPDGHCDEEGDGCFHTPMNRKSGERCG